MKDMNWISVKDRLPELNIHVLVCFTGTMTGNKLMKVDYTLQYHNNDVEWKHTSGGITHWMPLPEPPLTS